MMVYGVPSGRVTTCFESVLLSWPPLSLATANPLASVGDAVPAVPVALDRLPCVPPAPWNMNLPFQSTGRRTSNLMPYGTAGLSPATPVRACAVPCTRQCAGRGTPFAVTAPAAKNVVVIAVVGSGKCCALASAVHSWAPTACASNPQERPASSAAPAATALRRVDMAPPPISAAAIVRLFLRI